jgi:hypothetical protein
MNKHLYHAKTPVLRFRKPDSTEFGARHCSGTILYTEPFYEWKPITWFLGLEEHSGHQAWITKNTKNNEVFDHDVYIGNVVQDGSVPMDDLEIDLRKLVDDYRGTVTWNDFLVSLGEIPKSNSRSFSSELYSRSLSKNSETNRPQAVITGKTTPKDFIAEVRSFCKLETIHDFETFINFLTRSRYEQDAFANEKKVCKGFLPGTYRSINQLAAAKEHYWLEIWEKSARQGVLAQDILSVTDTEILRFFESRTQPGQPQFLDERNLLDLSKNEFDKTITENTVLYIGKPKKKEKKSSWESVRVFGVCFGYGRPGQRNEVGIGGNDCLFKFIFSHDYEVFDVYSINKMDLKKSRGYNSSAISLSGEVSKSSSCIDYLGKKMGSLDPEYPGYISGVKVECLPEFFREIETYLSNESICGGREVFVEILPSTENDTKNSSWAKTLSRDVYVNTSPQAMVKISGHYTYIQDLTHNELEALEDKISKMFLRYPDLSVRRRTNGKLEERRAVIADKLSVIYATIEPFLKYHLKFALGNPSIKRPFIVVKEEESTGNNTRFYSSLAHYTYEHGEDNSKYNKPSKDSYLTIIPVVSTFYEILSLYNGFKSFKKIDKSIATKDLSDRATSANWKKRGSYSASSRTATDVDIRGDTYMNMNMLELPGIDEEIIHPDGGFYLLNSIREENQIPKCLEYESPNKEILLDLSHINDYHIYSMLIATCLELCIENDTFFNFAVEGQLLRPKDILNYIIQERVVKSRLLIRSIYSDMECNDDQGNIRTGSRQNDGTKSKEVFAT